MEATKRAAIYCRISLDAEGDELGVQRQEDDCRELAAARGMDVVEVYRDNDMGASTRSRAKRRPSFDRLLADAAAGRFAVVLAYSNSRLTRRPAELETLIALHEQHGTTIETVVSGADDLSTADGGMVARIKANVDTAEAERISERVTRRHLENAREGRPVGGTRPFGWRADKVTVNPAEAALIRQAAADVVRGIPLRRIVDAWREAGVSTSRGAAWSSQTVRQMLRSPRLAGYRVHRGAVALDRAGRPVRGQWEAILDDDTHAAVVAALSRPDGRSRIPRKGARHYMLTGLLRCAVCNGSMYGNKAGETFSYRCHGDGHTNAVSGPGADDVVAGVILARLATEDFTGDVPEPPPVSARVGEIGEQIEELMGAYVAGKLTGAIVFPAVEELEAERAGLRRERDQAAAASKRPDVTQLDTERWEAMDNDERRAMCETLFSAVLVKPAEKRANRFDPTRVEPIWRTT